MLKVPLLLLSLTLIIFACGRGLFFNRIDCNQLLGATYTIDTLAGQSGASGQTEGDFGLAEFFSPKFLYLASDEETLFVTESSNHVIRRLDLLTDQVFLYAGTYLTPGSADGTNITATFSSPFGIAEKSNGDLIVSQTTHILRTVGSATVNYLTGNDAAPATSDGIPGTAAFNIPVDLAVDNDDFIIVTDSSNGCIREINPAGNFTSTIAGLCGTPGDQIGVGSVARFTGVNGIAFDSDQNLYLSDSSNHKIKFMDRATTEVSFLAGNGTPGSNDGDLTGASFNNPVGLHQGFCGQVFVADFTSNKIRRINKERQEVHTIAGDGSANSIGDGGPALFGSLNGPNDVVEFSDGRIFVAESNGHVIRVLTPILSED